MPLEFGKYDGICSEVALVSTRLLVLTSELELT